MEEKVFKNYAEQVDILRKRHLVVDEEDIEILKYENYYEIINGYKELFLSSRNPDVFIKGSSFKEIYSLYSFDRNLRMVFLKYIIKVEHYIKSVLAYEFSLLYGYKEYMKTSNFDISNDEKKKKAYKLISKIYSEVFVNIDKNDSIKHYALNHGYIPLWVLTSILTIGELSYFYESLKESDKNRISRVFHLNPYEFNKYIKNLSLARNICAHDDKLFNVKFKNEIIHSLIPNYQILNISEHNNTKGRKDLFSIAIIISLILSKNDVEEFINSIENEINLLRNNLKSISVECIMNLMGFVENWENIKNIKENR